MTYKSVICRASCYQIVKKSSFFSEGGDFIDGGEKGLVLCLIIVYLIYLFIQKLCSINATLQYVLSTSSPPNE